MKKLSEYTIATNCADIVDCQDGVAEIREEIDRRYRHKQDVPLYFYSRLDKLEKKLEKLAMKNYGMSYREAVIKFGYDNLRGMGKTSDEEKMKKSLKFKVGDYIEHTASAPFYHKVTAVGDLYYTTETYDYVTHQRRGTSKVGIGAQDVYRKIDNPQSDKSDISLFQFAQLLSSRFDDGESYDWAKVQKMAKELGVKSTQQELMQACELAVVLSARQIAHNGQSIAQRFAAMKDLYGQQVTVRPLDTQSKILQQYSTPCPLAFLLGVFVDKNDQFWNGRILEPSAGNGLLTVALHESQTVVNEIDEIRVANLKQLGFASVTSEDASSESAMQKFGNKFRGIITNPPFAKLADKDKIERHGWPINTLDYKMAVLALDRMSDNGKAAIIVGGKMWNSYWKPLSERSEKQVLFGQWKTFLGYLYAQYNVADVIYINGENIYRKQGTTYPIVAILVDGRHEYDESVKPNYVFDSERDVIIDTFDQLLERIMPHLDPNRHDEAPAISLLKAKFGKNVRPSDYEATGDNPIHAYKYPTGTMYADTRFQLHDSNGWDFLPVAFRFDSGTVDVKCNVLPEYEQLIDSLKDNDMRKRLARAKAKALLMYAYAQEQNDGHLVDGSQKSSERHGVEVALNIPMLEKGIDSILSQYSGRDAAAAQVERYMEESVFVSRAWLKQKGLENREQFRKWLANRQSVVRRPIVAERRKELQQANEYFANYRVNQMLDEAHQQAEAWENAYAQKQNEPKFNCKHLTAEDVAALMDSGHNEADIPQIDDIADIATYKIAPMPYGSDYELDQFEQMAKPVTLNRAIELVGRKNVIFGLARLAFHGWSGSVTRGNSQYTLMLSAPKSYWIGGVDGAVLNNHKKIKDCIDVLNGAETEHEKRIAKFIMEIGTADLNDMENQFFEAFIETQGYKMVQISDLFGLFNCLRIQANDYGFGSKHILVKHYGVTKDYVTADEIVKIGEIIKSVKPEPDEEIPYRHIYRLEKNGIVYKVVVDVKRGKTGVLITFYTDRK